MGESLHKSKQGAIPVEISEEDFSNYIMPHLSLPKRGPKCKIGYWRVFNYIIWVLYTGAQWKMIPIAKDEHGKPIIHYTQIYRNFARWSDDGSLEEAFVMSVGILSVEEKLDLSVLHGDGTNTIAKKGGDLIGYSGHKHQKGEKILAIVDNNGYVLAPLTAAAVNETDMVLLADNLSYFRMVVNVIGLVLAGTILNLDAGFDSKDNRKLVHNSKMIPNIKENPRNRKSLKRGRKRFFDTKTYKLRFTVERVFAWEDKFRRLLIRWEFFHQRHMGFHLIAFTLINLREFLC